MLKSIIIYTLLLASGGIGIAYYILLNKYNSQNLQIRMLTRQNHGLASQINSINKPTDNIKIYYKTTPYKVGYTKNNCSLYISPLSNSHILRSVPFNTKVEIIDLVEIYEMYWYEVKLITSETTNIKGFIREEFIKGIDVVETHVVSRRSY